MTVMPACLRAALRSCDAFRSHARRLIVWCSLENVHILHQLASHDLERCLDGRFDLESIQYQVARSQIVPSVTALNETEQTPCQPMHLSQLALKHARGKFREPRGFNDTDTSCIVPGSFQQLVENHTARFAPTQD